MAQPAVAHAGADVERLSEALAEALRTGDAGDVFTDDLFLDGHPPYWRFQLEGIDAFRAWLAGYVGDGREVEIVRTIATSSGFLAELAEAADTDRGRLTGRQLVVCEVRGDRISELTVFCNGEWDDELRTRHAAEAPMLRP